MNSNSKPSRTVRAALLGLALSSVAQTGCATILGTAVSPITGGVDLTRRFIEESSGSRLWATPFVFLGGVISGPFVAFYNGVNYDPTIFKAFDRYWTGFGDVFRPFDMVRRW